MRSTPLKRTSLRPRAPRSERQRDPDRVRSMPAVTPGAFRAPQPVASAPSAQVAKAAPVRSEAYRRAVASLPCIACGIQGYSQAAHLPPEAKGMGCRHPAPNPCHGHLAEGPAAPTVLNRRRL